MCIRVQPAKSYIADEVHSRRYLPSYPPTTAPSGKNKKIQVEREKEEKKPAVRSDVESSRILAQRGSAQQACHVVWSLALPNSRRPQIWLEWDVCPSWELRHGYLAHVPIRSDFGLRSCDQYPSETPSPCIGGYAVIPINKRLRLIQ